MLLWQVWCRVDSPWHSMIGQRIGAECSKVGKSGHLLIQILLPPPGDKDVPFLSGRNGEGTSQVRVLWPASEKDRGRSERASCFCHFLKTLFRLRHWICQSTTLEVALNYTGRQPLPSLVAGMLGSPVTQLPNETLTCTMTSYIWLYKQQLQFSF